SPDASNGLGRKRRADPLQGSARRSKNEQSGLPANGAPQEGIAERYERRYVLVALAMAVPSRRKFVEMCFVAHCLQLRRHLAGVAWMGAVVAAAGRDQDRRIGLARRRDVIGGEAREELPILRLVGIAVFVDPPRAGAQLGVSAHVDDRDRAEQRAEAL